MKRRRFCQTACLSGMSISALSCSKSKESGNAAAKRSALSIIDTHQHLWNIRVDRPEWLSEERGIREEGNMADYIRAIDGLNIVKAVYMEVAIETHRLDYEAEYVIKMCEREDNPTIAAVIGGRPTEDTFKSYIIKYKDSPYVKGVRYIMYQLDLLRQKPLIGNLRLLGDLNLTFDINVAPELLSEAIRIADDCPDTKFIVDHCGNADPVAFLPTASPAPREPKHAADLWKRDMEALAKRKNVVCKISGVVDEVPEGWTRESITAIVDFCLDTFGPDRVVFASDWPVCLRGATLKEWLDALWAVVQDRPVEELKKLFYDNAVHTYNLT